MPRQHGLSSGGIWKRQEVVLLCPLDKEECFDVPNACPALLVLMLDARLGDSYGAISPA